MSGNGDIRPQSGSASGPVLNTASEADESLDLRGVKCPINFVKIKLKLEEMDDGQNLEVIIDTGEPMRNIPRAIKEEGHRITSAEKLSDDAFSLLVNKGGGRET
jgi:tRNA 2-thiouridine synthesizing protein A